MAKLQPSQLYISKGKLRLVLEWFEPAEPGCFDPISVKRLNDRIIMTDGHTRVVAAHLAGWYTVPVYWDEDELDMRAYAIDVKWCDEEGVHNPVDLAKRIVPHKEYERLWRKRCMEMVLTD
ncbi:MAG TPA: ParB N-terminal domain-containing protein [Clostridiales bacterium]|nr:ParB N-terminal domain-containing protein [Clostridiales bacterium]